MRKFGIILGIVVAILLLGVFLVPALINVNNYRDRIQAELQKRLDRPVTLGQLHLSIIPLAFRADNAAIGEDPRFRSTQPFAQADELDVSAALMPLLHGDVQINSLTLKRPHVELIRNPQGVWNFSSLGSNSSPAKSSQQQNFSLENLAINDGQIAITDYQNRQPRAVYDHIDLKLSGYAPNRPFSIEAAAHLPGSNNQVLSLKGDAGPIDNATPVNTPVKGKVEFQNVSIAGLQRFLNLQQLEGSDAIITGTADLTNQPAQFASDGSLKLENVRLHGHDIGYPISADYSVAGQNGMLQINKGNLKLGGTPLTVTGTMNTKATPSQINLRLVASNVSISEAARLAAAAGIAFNPGMNIAGQLAADVRAQGSTSNPVMDGTINASNLVMSGKDLPQPVSVNAIQLALTPTEVRSNQFTASTGGTTLNGRFTLQQYSSPSPLVDADLNTSNANVAELLSIAKAYGVTAADGVTGSGAVSLNMHATGPIKNTAAMNFAGSGAVQNATLKTPGLTTPVSIRNATLRFSQNSAILENLAGSLGSSNATGALTLRDFVNPQVQFMLSLDKLNATEMEGILGAAAPQRTADFWQLVPRADAASTQPGIVQRASGTGSISIGTLTYQDMVLSNVHSNVELDHGIIKLNPVTAQLYGGQEAGSVVVDTRPTPATYTVTSKLSHVDANQLLSSVSSLKQTLFGLLAANAGTSFTSSGGDIARSLNGNANLDLQNGKLAHVDLLYELANIGKFLNTGKTISQHPFTNLVRLTGDFNIRNGLAQTNNLQAVIDGATLGGVGGVNLADQSVNMRITAVLTKAMTASIGGNQIGGYMNTALANQNGEMVMPILVTGSLSSPRITPDFEQIARMKLQNLLPTSANPGGALSGILGSVLGGNKGAASNGGSAPPQSPTQPPGTLQDIFNSIGRKQQPSGNTTGQPATPPPGQQSAQQKQPGWADVLNGVLNSAQKNNQPPAENQPQKPQQQQQPPPPPPQ